MFRLERAGFAKSYFEKGEYEAQSNMLQRRKQNRGGHLVKL